MKKIVLSGILLLSIVGNIHAADLVPESRQAKDLCLLDSNKCEGHVRYDLLEKIKRLTIALKLGTSVYSPEEVEHLEKLLEEANQMLDDLSL